jgi:hypothetical protein
MSAMRIAYVGQSESRIAHGSNVFHPIRTKWNVFGEDLSNIIPAKIDYNEPILRGFRGEDQNMHC